MTQQTCQYCHKDYAKGGAIKAHERSCSGNPANQGEATPDIQPEVQAKVDAERQKKMRERMQEIKQKHEEKDQRFKALDIEILRQRRNVKEWTREKQEVEVEMAKLKAEFNTLESFVKED